MTISTVDSGSYYRRYGSHKKKFIRQFVLARKNKIHKIHDVGCNNGDMSAQFLEYGIDVLGVDASDSLIHPEGYCFKKTDIVNENSVYFNDCTLFLSLYHHILGAQGLETADRIFYQLLMRTNYLIFDTGNVTEKKRAGTTWYKAQTALFDSETRLLEHFGVSYEIIGSWKIAGGKRTLCVFRRGDFDAAAEVLDEFRRRPGRKNAKNGLTSVVNLNTSTNYFPGVRFYKIRMGKWCFFGKKWLDANQEMVERENIEEAYGKIDKEKLLVFFGVSPRYGLLYEWIENFNWKRKLKKKTIDGFYLHDGDLIEVDGTKKIIDFWSAREPRTPAIPAPGDTPQPAPDAVNDQLTVAVFTYKRPQSFLRCLQSMNGNKSIREFLIFNDDETQPLTPEWLSRHFTASVPARIFNPGDFGFTGRAFRKPLYMNKAIELASNTHILFSDDDGQFVPGAIDMHARALRTNRFCAGSIIRSRFFPRRSSSILQGTNYSFDTSFYRDIGGYNEKFVESQGGGDVEFWYRIYHYVKRASVPAAYLHHAIQKVKGRKARKRKRQTVDARRLFADIHKMTFKGPMYTWFPHIRDKKKWMTIINE